MNRAEHRAAVRQALRALLVAQLVNPPKGEEARASLDLLTDLLADEFALADIDAAVKAHLGASRFYPTPSELRDLALAGRGQRRSAEAETTDDEMPTPEELWEMAAWCASRPLPRCEGRCEGSGKVTDDEEEIAFITFDLRHAGRATESAREREWKPCPDGCLDGHARPTDEQVREQLRTQFGVRWASKVATFQPKRRGDDDER